MIPIDIYVNFASSEIFHEFCLLLIFVQNNFFEKFFQKNHQSVKQFGSRSGQAFCQAWSGFKLFAKFISRRH